MTKRKLTTLKPRIGMLSAARLATPARDSRSVYESRKWRERVRPAKLQRDPLCQRCLFLRLTVAAAHVDHWQRISEGGEPWAETNLVSLCADHHAEKSTLERAGQPLFEIAPSASSGIGWLG